MLHELVKYAEQQGLASEPGFKARLVRWLLVFDPQGRWVGIQDLTGDDKKSKGRMFAKCPNLEGPEMVAAGKGTRHFLVDGVDKVTLLTKEDEVTDKLASEHAFFVDLLRQASPDLAILSPIADALSDDAQLEAIRARLQEHKAKPTEMVTFAITDPVAGLPDILVQGDAWHDWWRGFRAGLVEARQAKTKKGADDAGMLCLLSGEVVTPASTHPKITGLSDVGGLSMGDALTSFDKESFGSYNLEQGQNAAISDAMAATYAGALNDLIRNRSKRLAGLKIAYWYSGEVKAEDDVLAEMMQGVIQPEGLTPDADDAEDAATAPTPGEARRSESRAAELLEAIRTGTRPDLQGARFYALTLSANSGRVVIRDWMEGSFESLVESVNQWFEHLSIVARDGKSVIRTHKFMAVVGACVRDLKDAPAPMQALLWQVAVKNREIPHHVMAQALNRVRLDICQGKSPPHARLGLLKAYLLRHPERRYQMTAELNEHETSPAYLCGRLLAILGSIQQRALGDVGAGVVQRYYAAASATPALVLGRLIRTAQTGHLPKIDAGLRYWFEQQLAEVWNQLKQAPPPTLTLEGQTLFAMGYYQQQARRKPAAAAPEASA